MEPTQENIESPLFQLSIDGNNDAIRNASIWARILGIVGIILGTLFILIAVLTLIQLSPYQSYNNYDSYEQRSVIQNMQWSLRGLKILLWMIFLSGGIFIVGGIFSNQFSNRLNTAIRSNDQVVLNNCFASLRNYFALRSIVLITILLVIIVMIAARL